MSGVAPRRRSWLWLQGLACGAALSLATAPALLVVGLLLPGLAGYTMERTPGKPVSETMLLLGVATVFMPLRILWEGGHSMEACLNLIMDPWRLGLSWTAAGAGWFMAESAQMIAERYGELAARRELAALRKERDELAAEWGPLEPVRTVSPRG